MVSPAKYPRAQVVPFSSVVGSSVTLHDPATERVIGQLAILNTGGDTPEERKGRQVLVAEDIAKRINAYDGLVAMLRECRATFDFAAGDGDDEAHGFIAEIDAVLAKAEGEPEKARE